MRHPLSQGGEFMMDFAADLARVKNRLAELQRHIADSNWRWFELVHAQADIIAHIHTRMT
jgi:hypothetical protein